MENAQLITLSRQTALRNQLTVVANNMANLNTSGYKAQRLNFEEYLMPVAEATEFPTPDETLSYVHDYATTFNFSEGGIRTTDNPFDLAVEGDGFFAVQMEDGTEAFTRNGAFHLDVGGTLVTATGRPVLTEGGPISFTTEDGQVEIARDGTISSELGARGRIRLVDFEDKQSLLQLGENLYVGNEPLPIQPIRGVVQGALEEANVDGVVEMTRLIEITRAYESVTKMQSDMDELRKTAIQTLGTLQA
ncbi:flagellar basal-body rod protein FlgF [Roseibium sp. CAU 1637]|uniref:Flagellar basal-body rod protein FlgF n=1 Tax=Roseibium limicola TaxID=2816037 RepID=A0A939EQ02_9HYPH|nr:flagellar basal-body rod protein FlgF [Roseibium limicola]MBO0344974.1 flagellar basal-body rod protein FlgF [Roseibium limicola]